MAAKTQKALLCVSFGTSVPEARNNVEAVENALGAAAPDRDFVRAFTSPTIRRILAERGETVLSLEEALQDLADRGYTDIVVQPTHLLFGVEYDKIAATVRSFEGTFSALALGRPLLAGQEDLDALAGILSERFPAELGTAYVLFGHGTSHYANLTYPALQTVFSLRARPDVLIGTVEGWPGLEEVRDELWQQTVDHVHLVPLMLVNGDHVMNDLNGSGEDSWRTALEQDGYRVTCHDAGLGMDPAVQDLYRKHLEELLARG